MKAVQLVKALPAPKWKNSDPLEGPDPDPGPDPRGLHRVRRDLDRRSSSPQLAVRKVQGHSRNASMGSQGAVKGHSRNASMGSIGGGGTGKSGEF